METHHPSSAGPPIATQLFTKQLSRPPIRRGCGGGDPPSVLALLCGIAVVSIGLLSLPLSQNDEVGVLPKLKRFMDSGNKPYQSINIYVIIGSSPRFSIQIYCCCLTQHKIWTTMNISKLVYLYKSNSHTDE